MPCCRTHLLYVAFIASIITSSLSQDTTNDSPPSPGLGDDTAVDAPPPPGLDTCDGVYISYTFGGRTKEYPHVKNATAQAYAFKATLFVLNAMTDDLKAWKVHVAFQHKEILVSADGAVLVGGLDFPANVENGTTFMGYPQVDLPSSISTAGDMSQISAKIDIVGTQFGVKGKGVPMPKDIKLVNDGFKCPKITTKGPVMSGCCIKDPKLKLKKTPTIQFLPRQNGDLTIMYDVLQAYGNNYQAQVTIDNVNPLGRLDNWNITWEWMRGEFINTMRGAYTFKKDGAACRFAPGEGERRAIGEDSSLLQERDLASTYHEFFTVTVNFSVECL